MYYEITLRNTYAEVFKHLRFNDCIAFADLKNYQNGTTLCSWFWTIKQRVWAPDLRTGRVKWLVASMKCQYRGRQPFSCPIHLEGTITLRIQYQILHVQLRASRSTPCDSSVAHQRSNLSNNNLSRHLVGTLP